MQTIKNLERLQKIHNLIVNECTGTPAEISTTMRISVRLVYNFLECLKDYVAQINYSRSRKTYYYKTNFELNINFNVQVKSENRTTQILGVNSKGAMLNKYI